MVKYEDIKLSPTDALNVYLEKYPNTMVKEVELKLKSNSYVYEVEGYDDESLYEIYIDPVEGKILEIKKTLSDRSHTSIKVETTEKIEDIVTRALQDAGENSELVQWKLELENGVLELKMTIKLESAQEVKYEYHFGTDKLLKK